MAQEDIVAGVFGMTPEMYQAGQTQRDIAAQQAAGEAAGGLFAKAYAPQIQQQAQLNARALGGLLGIEDPQLQMVREVSDIRNQFDITTPEGMQSFAQAIAPKYPQLAMQALDKVATLEDMRSKAELRRAQADKALRGPVTSPEQLLTSGKYTPASVARYQQTGNIGDLKLVNGAEGGEGGLGKLNTAEKAIDTKFGKEYVEYFAGGGINNLDKNVSELARAIKLIEDAPEGATSGKLIGLADKTGQLTFASQLASDVKDIIGGVAQSNLRQVLGGQFAQKEGEALLQRQYDTGQTKANNLKRLKALYKQATDTIQDKKAAAEYYEQFGTLKGFKAPKRQEETTAEPNVNKEALDWIKANPNDPRVPAIKKKLGI